MAERHDKTSRKDILKSFIVLPSIAAAVVASSKIADAKTPPAVVKYQTKPKGTAKCSGCKFYVPGKSATANGTCTIVDGPISPNGWCTVYAAK